MSRAFCTVLIVLCCTTAARAATPLPDGFVYLSNVAPTIVQDIRYAGSQNIVGKPLPGYLAPRCILTKSAAQALAKAQAELLSADLTLRVYDCYRPRRAVAALVAWSNDRSDQRMKPEYYPRVEKSELVPLGYLSSASAHARGSSVDLTVERLPLVPPAPWAPGQHSCIAPLSARYHDGSIDMGSNYDCMDRISRSDANVGAVANTHRAMLRDLMERYGFTQSGDLWWSFVLNAAPFAKTTFDFPIK